MRFLILIICLIAQCAKAQTALQIMEGFKSINDSIATLPCSSGHGMLISNRAMNVLLANKIGSYLSGRDDLSFYKNNVTFNAADKEVTINHSLFQASGLDQPIKSSMIVGIKANISNVFADPSSGKSFTNDVGFTLRHTWIGKTNSHYNPCKERLGTGVVANDHKHTMDALRASILHSLEKDILIKSDAFETSLNAIAVREVPGQTVENAKAIARSKFYPELKESFSRQFAELQAEALINSNKYQLIKTNWTSFSVYIPLVRESFLVAQSLSAKLEQKHCYPMNVSLSHTQFWESTNWGRMFLTVAGSITLNNSSGAQQLTPVTLFDYRRMGGTDTIEFAKHSGEAFIGAYKNFLTPTLSGKVVYIPRDWHFGMTFIIEQNFGTYKALNGVFGIPIVLINKNAEPSANFEFQFRYFDISNVIRSGRNFTDKLLIGITVGVPFSKMVY